MTKKKMDEFVELEINVPSFLQEFIWYRWRFSDAYHKVSWEVFRERYVNEALKLVVWKYAPRMLVAGTDGYIGAELL